VFMKALQTSTLFSEIRSMGLAAIVLVYGLRAMGVGHTIVTIQTAWFTVPLVLGFGLAAYIGLVSMVEYAWNMSVSILSASSRKTARIPVRPD